VKAARIHSFGPPGVVVVEDVPVPSPGPGEVLVRVMAAGVAPWDALIREGENDGRRCRFEVIQGLRFAGDRPFARRSSLRGGDNGAPADAHNVI
jgi:NADPH:quinone reductase-like Zn-dependent oxidoreductase